MNSKCIYFVEGECEKQLINALKISPEILTPGKASVRYKENVDSRAANSINGFKTGIMLFKYSLQL